MKNVLLALLISLWSNASLASDDIELKKDRAALIATRLVFPKEGQMVDKAFFRFSKEKIHEQISALKSCQNSQAFFEIYRRQLNLVGMAVTTDRIEGLPLHIYCMSDAIERFKKTSHAHAQAVDNSKLFRVYKRS